MKSNREATFDVLPALIRERGYKVLERFAQVAVSGISNIELLSMLEEVKCYWSDLFRPALISFCSEAVGAQPEIIVDAGVILTLVDAGTSIHDDIVDKSLRKHFRTTIFGNHGIENALLVGDLLIVKAWSLVHEMIRKTDKPLTIADFAEAYGRSCMDMCEAELASISCRRKLETDLNFCEEVLWKVNSGIKACAEIGPIIGGGKESEIKALSEVGKSLALMLGLKDDVKDMLNVEGCLLHRIEHESVPLPLLYAAQSSRKRYSKIESIINKAPLASLDARELLRLCFEADSFAYVGKLAHREAAKATFQLDSLKASYARNILKLIIDDSAQRVLDSCL